MSRIVYCLVSVAALATGACGDGNQGPVSMAGPSGMGTQGDASAFMSIVPAGTSTGVSTSTSITVQFGGTMAAGMEQYVDLHVGSVEGPTVPMGCSWSAERTTLTCHPAAALDPHTTYMVHLGGGMTTQAGARVDYGHHGPMMGGYWVTGGMMGGNHAGHPWGAMGPGWHDAHDGYGMAFPFTTA
jgi:hypothetical protein